MVLVLRLKPDHPSRGHTNRTSHACERQRTHPRREETNEAMRKGHSDIMTSVTCRNLDPGIHVGFGLDGIVSAESLDNAMWGAILEEKIGSNGTPSEGGHVAAGEQ